MIKDSVYSTEGEILLIFLSRELKGLPISDVQVRVESVAEI